MSFRYFTKWRQPHSKFQKSWKTLKSKHKCKAHQLVFWVTLQFTTNIINDSRHFCRVISWGFLLALSSSPTRLKTNKHETPLSTAFYLDAPKASTNWWLCKRKMCVDKTNDHSYLLGLGQKCSFLVSIEAKQGTCFLPIAPGSLQKSTRRWETFLFTSVSSSVNSKELPYLSSISHRSWMYQEPFTVSRWE